MTLDIFEELNQAFSAGCPESNFTTVAASVENRRGTSLARRSRSVVVSPSADVCHESTSQGPTLHCLIDPEQAFIRDETDELTDTAIGALIGKTADADAKNGSGFWLGEFGPGAPAPGREDAASNSESLVANAILLGDLHSALLNHYFLSIGGSRRP